MRLNLSLAIGLSLLLVLSGLDSEPESQMTWSNSVTREAESTLHTFRESIDAFSFDLGSHEELEVSWLLNNQWSEPIHVHKDLDGHPRSTESELVVLPEPTHAVRIHSLDEFAFRPIRVSKEPISYTVASRLSLSRPRIISRRSWGANEEWLYTRENKPTHDNGDFGNNGNGEIANLSDREAECLEFQRKYPNEFKTVQTITTNHAGHKYIWSQKKTSDQNVKLIFIHHTAQKNKGDRRAEVERVRALEKYHSQIRGYGDIGYHFLIDSEGNIYEGRSGGHGVVGGHAYCYNHDRGIAMLGNFEEEKPTQAQMRSLKWLVDYLAKEYNIDLNRKTRRYGQLMDPIVGHNEVASTACPGYYVKKVMNQLRGQIRKRQFAQTVVFPRLPQQVNRNRIADRRRGRIGDAFIEAPSEAELTLRADFAATDTLVGRPGSQQLATLVFKPNRSVNKGTVITTVERSNKRIGIWEQRTGTYTRVRRNLKTKNRLKATDTEVIQLKLQMPSLPGDYWVKFNDHITLKLKVEGRRQKSPKQEPVLRTSRAQDRINRALPRNNHRVTSAPPKQTAVDQIRIRLTKGDSNAYELSGTNPLRVNEQLVADQRVTLERSGSSCIAKQSGNVIATGVVRVDAGFNGLTTITPWRSSNNKYRGLIECQVVNDELAIINELGLEEYLWGVAEEPDTEPRAKQEAFAIAARSYAAHYMQEEFRKFPGMPYDGNDSPANFQMYGGYMFERVNPRWKEVVKETAGTVLMKDGEIVKAAYYSGCDGRTRHPDELGWRNFTFADSVYISQSIPHCSGTQRGHGVGMAGESAHGLAKNDGWSATRILEFFYPTTTLGKLNF